MADWTPNSASVPADDASDLAGLMPVTPRRVPVRIAAVANDETTPGMVCVGAYLDDRLLSLTEVSPAAYRHLLQIDWAGTPVRLALPAEALADGTVIGMLCAFLPVHLLPPTHQASPVPRVTTPAPAGTAWRASGAVSSPWDNTDAEDAEAAPAEAALDGGDEDTGDREAHTVVVIDGEAVALFPLGCIKRLPKSREFPNEARHEAHAMLTAILAGKAMRLIDKIIETEGF